LRDLIAFVCLDLLFKGLFISIEFMLASQVVLFSQVKRAEDGCYRPHPALSLNRRGKLEWGIFNPSADALGYKHVTPLGF